jgi:hypothetical protein
LGKAAARRRAITFICASAASIVTPRRSLAWNHLVVG